MAQQRFSSKFYFHTTGFRKPFSYYEQSLYQDAPMVSIAVDNPDFAKEPAKYLNANWDTRSSLTGIGQVTRKLCVSTLSQIVRRSN